MNLRLGDRFFVESVLLDVFGEAARETTTKLIFRAAAIFGGPCDIYDQVRVAEGPGGFLEPRTVCPGGKGSANLPMIGMPNMLRQSYVTRACESLTAQTATLDFALKKIFPSGDLAAPDSASLKAAYARFNMEKTPASQVLESLAKVAAGEANLRKRWAMIYLTLCLDPQWQAI